MPRTGDAEVVVRVGQGKRYARVHAPSALLPQSTAVLAFHGAGEDADRMRADTHLDQVADERGLVVVYARGTEWTDGGHVGATWNAGSCCGPASDLQVDDLGFVRALIDEVLIPDYCVDPRRVFATGFSNGAFFTHRLACELSDRIAGIASVSGTNITAPCTPSRPVPVLHVHGTADPGVLYEGGGVVPQSPSARRTAADWAARNGCAGSPIEVYRVGDSHCDQWQLCPEVQLCSVEDAGHAWPGSLGLQGGGYPSPNLDASRYMADFFSRQSPP